MLRCCGFQVLVIKVILRQLFGQNFLLMPGLGQAPSRFEPQESLEQGYRIAIEDGSQICIGAPRQPWQEPGDGIGACRQ
jgi:hypothetical protein